MSAADVVCVVVTWNSEGEIDACLDALLASDLPVTVVVVDNGSTDGTVARVRRRPEVVLDEAGENLGYVGGNNRGIGWAVEAGARYALLVNPDVLVEPACVGRLVAAAEREPRAALVSPKVRCRAPADELYYAGATIDWATGETPHVGLGETDRGQYDEPGPTDRAYGGVVLVRLAATADVGLMDERYFLYYEETDWSVRFREAGFEVRYEPSAVAVNDVAASGGGAGTPTYWYYLTRNRLLFASQFASARLASVQAAVRRDSARNVKHWLRHPTPENRARIAATAQGHLDFARHRFGRRPRLPTGGRAASPPVAVSGRPVTYLRPATGGVRAYSDVTLDLLGSQHPDWAIDVVTVGSPRWRLAAGLRLARRLRHRSTVVMAELGANDAAVLWCLAFLPRRTAAVVTIHDPGVVIDRLVRVAALDQGPWPLPGVGLRVSRLARRTFEPALLRRVLERVSVRLVLNPAVPTALDLPVGYLPAAVYGEDRPPHTAPERPAVAYLGFWSAAKGLDDLLDAYRRLLPDHPGTRFVLAGGGAGSRDPYGDGVRSRAAEIGHLEGGRVELPGYVPDDELDHFIAGLTVLVLPYHDDVPGAASGMLMRTQEAGVPVIVTDVPALRAQVDPANVRLVPPGDVDALTRAIAEVLADPAAADAAARREQDRVHREHGRDVVGRRITEILQPLVER